MSTVTPVEADTFWEADGPDPAAVVAAVRTRYPSLSVTGFALVNSLRFDPARQAADREAMTGARAIEEFHAALAFLSAAASHHLARPAPGRTTDTWRRLASRWVGVEISNGMFICAALALGWKVSPIRDAPTGTINLAATARSVAEARRP